MSSCVSILSVCSEPCDVAFRSAETPDQKAWRKLRKVLYENITKLNPTDAAREAKKVVVKGNFTRLLSDNGDAGAPVRAIVAHFATKEAPLPNTNQDFKRALWAVAEGVDGLRDTIEVQPSDTAVAGPPSDTAVAGSPTSAPLP